MGKKCTQKILDLFRNPWNFARGILLSSLLSFKVMCLMLCTSACGYHFNQGSLIHSYSSVCIPFVEGDDDGMFTTALIRAISSSGCVSYRSACADLVLNVCLLEPLDTNIGFIYAPPDEGDDEFSDIIVSNEARLKLTARISLVDRRTSTCILGPIIITSSITYDFEPDLGNVDFHAFSLGQLEMHNLAQDAAFRPLYDILAYKIVDYIKNSW